MGNERARKIGTGKKVGILNFRLPSKMIKPREGVIEEERERRSFDLRWSH